MSRKSRIAAANAAAAREQAAKERKKQLILIAAAVVAVIILAVCLAVFGGKDAQPEATATPVPTAVPEITPVASHWVEIEVQDYGTITAELYDNVAPITVNNFVSLAEEGFYDGLTFHRIISGFMIQGGDPLDTGAGGSDATITGEFTNNGIYNPLSHERGVLSMARLSYDANSASSQFFIMHEDSTSLDGDYAAFGKVLTGMEIVDAICADTPVTDANGSVAAENQPVITAIRVVGNPANQTTVETEPSTEPEE